MDFSTPDKTIREEALNPSGSFIVEAPAGSGKTDLLIARFLGLLGRVAHPGQILALTYTRKAAIEMKRRVMQKLNQATEGTRKNPESPWEAQLLSLARRALRRHGSHPAILFNPESLQIGTFHSFCASLLKRWPVESKIPPGLDVLDDIAQEAILQKAVDQYVRSLLSEGAPKEEVNAYVHRLAGVNNSPDALADQLKNLLRRRDRLKDFPLPSSGEESLESLKSRLHGRLENYGGNYLRRLNDGFAPFEREWATLKKALRKGGIPFGEIFPGSIPGPSLADLAEWKKASEVFLTKSKSPRKRVSAADGFTKEFRCDPAASFILNLPGELSGLLSFISGWPDPGEDSLGLDALADILILSGGAWTGLEELLRNQGMDYLELEMATLRALEQERPSESLIFQHDHLRHILVDEAQDMNDLQLEILSRLTEGWEPGDGRTVFAVGDPKQSIYRFRRAEVTLFNDLKEKGLPRTGEFPLPMKPLLLTANFRSRPHLIALANRLFDGVMGSPRKEYDEVEFFRSQPVRDEMDQFRVTRVAIFNDEKESKETVLSPREREARWVAAEVTGLHRKKPEETIAILIPARTHLPLFVGELMRREVPLRLLEGERMDERPEVRHLLNLFTAMVRPYDDVAWAGAVRGVWHRVPNRILFDLKDSSGFWSERILSMQGRTAALVGFCEAVKEARKMFGRESYGATLSRLWEDLECPRHTAALYGAAGVSNTRTFFDLLDLCSGMPGEEALLQINRLLEEAYTPPDPGGAFSNVSMMTIHKAKGLEFDHVFAVHLDYDALSGGRAEQPAFRMERLPGEEKHFLAAATADRRTGQQNLGSFLLKDLGEKRTLAETRRLFYVAVTRARENLTLSGTGKLPKNGDDDEFKTSLSSLLRAMKDEEKMFRLLVNPAPTISVDAQEKFFRRPSSLPPFPPEPLPYLVASPSRIEDETSLATEPGMEEEEGFARARGVVIHRLLERLSRNQPAPRPESIAVTLAAEGIPHHEAQEMAFQVLDETLKAWDEVRFLALRQSAKVVHAEWAVEDFDGLQTVRVGRFDLLLGMEDCWLLVDYKTGRPEKEAEAWVQDQLRRHRPQLNAYAEMAARALHLPEKKVEWAILFTTLPRLVREKD
jgi:ATP-dependent exoDNAse (exonuclease V) beta subunit